MPGYHVLRSDRRQGCRDDTQTGGGVITLVREGIAFRRPERPCVAPNGRTTDWCVVEKCEAPKISHQYVHSTHPERRPERHMRPKL